MYRAGIETVLVLMATVLAGALILAWVSWLVLSYLFASVPPSSVTLVCLAFAVGFGLGRRGRIKLTSPTLVER
jgi:hypothetical protein